MKLALLWVTSLLSIASGEYCGTKKDALVESELAGAKKELLVLKVTNSELEKKIQELPKWVVRTKIVRCEPVVVTKTKHDTVVKFKHDTIVKKDTIVKIKHLQDKEYKRELD